MMKRAFMSLAFLTMATTVMAGPAHFDETEVRWGMTNDEVIAYEGRQPDNFAKEQMGGRELSVMLYKPVAGQESKDGVTEIRRYMFDENGGLKVVNVDIVSPDADKTYVALVIKLMGRYQRSEEVAGPLQKLQKTISQYDKVELSADASNMLKAPEAYIGILAMENESTVVRIPYRNRTEDNTIPTYYVEKDFMEFLKSFQPTVPKKSAKSAQR